MATPPAGQTVTAIILDRDGDTVHYAVATDDSGAPHRVAAMAVPTSAYVWYLDTSRLPRGLSASETEAELLDQTGLRRERYEGRTNLGNMSSATELCATHDQLSVVSFGDIRGDATAIACMWTRGGAAVELDITINRSELLFTGGPRAGLRGTSLAQLVRTVTRAASTPSVVVRTGHGTERR